MELPAIPPADAFRFRTRRRTRWSDEDNQRVLNNAVYLSLLEEARFDYFTDLELVCDNQFPFVLMQTNIRFLAPGTGGAVVEVEACTTELGTSSFLQAYRVTEVEEGRLLCEAEALLVAWSNEHRCKVPMAPDFRRRIAAFEGLDAGE